MEKNVRPGREIANGEVVAALLCRAAQKQDLLATRVERHAAIARALRNRRERRTVLDRRPRDLRADLHRTTGEMHGRHVSHPDITRGVQVDRVPRVLFVEWIAPVVIRFATQVLDAGAFDVTGLHIRLHRAAAVAAFERHRQRRVQGKPRTVHRHHAPVPAHVEGARFPNVGLPTWGLVHSDRFYPLNRARTFHRDTRADGDSVVGPRQRELRGANRHFLRRQGDRRAHVLSPIIAAQLDQRPATLARRHQDGARFTGPNPAENNPTRANLELPLNLVAPGVQLHGPAKTRRVGSQARHEIDRGLQTRTIVAGGRRHPHTGRDHRQSDTATPETGARKIRHAVTALIDEVGQLTRLRLRDGRWLLLRAEGQRRARPAQQ